MATQATQQSQQPNQVVRIPFLETPHARDTGSGKDLRFVNGYFEPIKNQIKNRLDYFYTKRPGLSQNVRPSGGAATGRGVYVWKGNIYSVFGTKIYKGSTDLGVTLTTSTGRCYFAETRPGAATQYLTVNDGVAFYCIATNDTVVVMNNIVITSSSVANPTTITATAHGLATGNKIIIRNHTGSTPSINDTIYTITKTGTNTFTIPVNVTVGGSGGTIGVTPTATTRDLQYMDTYLFALDTSANLWNSNSDDPTTWNASNFITSQMVAGKGTGLAKQANMMVVFTDRHHQVFYDAINVSGSPLSNAEQYMHKTGCDANDTIKSVDDTCFWVGNSFIGGYTVWKMVGTGTPEDIGVPPLNRILSLEGTSLASARAILFRHAGHTFYILTLVGVNRSFVYDGDIGYWYEWTDTTGALAWPIFETSELNDGVIAQHTTNGWIYNVSSAVFQDDSTNFTVTARTPREDIDTMVRKFVNRLDLVGDAQATTENISVSYSDDDYQTFSTARTFDISIIRQFGKAWGNFRRRSWQIQYLGSQAFRMLGIELDVSVEK